VTFRDLQFEVPEFPHGGVGGAETSPPPALGEHTAAVLASAGVGEVEYLSLLESGGAAEATPGAFAWAPVRREA